jgi:cardiolipin synthase
MLRVAMVPPLVCLMRDGNYGAALGLGAVAAASDALDGWLAKRFQWQTPLGGVLDPVADKLLLLACFVGLWGAGPVPGWLLALILGRDLLIVAGAVSYHVLFGALQARPTLLGKLTTVVQIGFVLGLLFELAGGPLPPFGLPFGIVLVTAVTVASGVDYVQDWSRRALREARRRRER